MFCGSRKIAQGTRVEEVFHEDEDEGDNVSTLQDEPGGGKARDIMEVPQCANCMVEVELDSLDQDTVVQKALRRVDKADGGLTRLRWERREGIISRSAHGKMQRVPGQIMTAPGEHVGGSRLHSSRLVVDGAYEDSWDEARRACIVPLESTIYVSILDPMGELAFKPNPTKPIPQWMQMLPSQRPQQRQAEPRPRSVLDEHFKDVTSASAYGTSKRSRDVMCPTIPEHAPPRLLSPPRESPQPKSTSSQHSEFDELPDITITIPQGRKTVASEPLKRPSSRAMTTQGGTGIHRPRSPRLHRSSSPLAAATGSVMAHLKSIIRRTPPPQSKEYLDLYKPMTLQKKQSPSIAVAGRKGSREGLAGWV
jgi:hypothetical protein